MTDAQARARGPHRPLVVVLTPLAHASAPALTVVAAVLAALVGASVALAVLLIVAVLRVVRPRLDGRL